MLLSLLLACFVPPGPDRVTVQVERIRELEAEVERLKTANEGLSDLAVELIEHGNKMNDPCGILIQTGSTIFLMSHPLGQPETEGYETWELSNDTVAYTGERSAPSFIVEGHETCGK